MIDYTWLYPLAYLIVAWFVIKWLVKKFSENLPPKESKEELERHADFYKRHGIDN